MAASKSTREKRATQATPKTGIQNSTALTVTSEEKSARLTGDAWLEHVYGGKRPPRLRRTSSYLLEKPHEGMENQIGDRNRVPFITKRSNTRHGRETNFWNPGPPPKGMSESKWGACMAASFMELVRVESLAGRGGHFGFELNFIRYDMPSSPTAVELGFWQHLAAYLEIAAAVAHKSQTEIAGMAGLGDEAKLAAVRALFHQPAAEARSQEVSK